MMNYDEALEKIHEFNVFGSKLGLERMHKLLSLLGDPHKSLRIIHVAGTNGKGSVCRFLYSILNECGYKAGAFFSPYLQEFTERIECGGRQISKNELPVYAERVLAAAAQMTSDGYESPTEFELVTAIGLLFFKEAYADFVILEVGLGGRGDSTNVCERPLVSVISSVSYDHMDVLGSTLEEIAAEKAGIIKPGVPVCVNVSDPGAFAVIQQKAIELRAPVVDIRQASLKIKKCDISGSTFTAGFDGLSLFRDIDIKMRGRHQIDNAVCALAAVAIMRIQGISIQDQCIKAGMKRAFQPGRFEIFSNEPCVILDGAHNTAGVTALTDTMNGLFSEKRVLLCTGMLADKEYEKMAQQLALLGADIITTEPPVPRRLAAQELAEAFAKCEPYKSSQRTVHAVPDWQEALREARERADEYDITLWTGSLYLIGAVRGALEEPAQIS